MTAARAEQLRQEVWARSNMTADRPPSTMTPEEKAEIRKHWHTLGGYASFYDAVCSLAKELGAAP